jgi:hypothetical protein
MTKKLSLAAGVALGVLALASASQAATKKAPAADPLAAQRAAEAAADIAAMKAQMQSLADRLTASEAAQAQLKAQLQQAQQAAQTSQTAAQQAQASAQQAKAEADTAVKQIPTQVKTEVASIKPKPSWADNTSVSGRMYFNASTVELKSNGNKVSGSGGSFDVKRFYLGVDHKFNDTWSANLTTDVSLISGVGETAYIKKAYLQAKYSDALTVRLGAADLPWIPFVEDLYGYRFMEQTLTDRTKFGTSADWGVHALGKLADGHINYAVAIVDGAGYRNPQRSDSPDIEGRISYNVDKFTFAVGGHSGKLGKDAFPAATFHTATRYDVLAAYVDKKFRLGAEYFTADNWNTVTSATKDSSDGYSVWGSVNMTDTVSAFARGDWEKPSKDINPSLKENYYNLGINWEPTKIVDLALVYKHDQVEHGSLSTGNGTIGGSNRGTYNEIGVFGQFRW